MMSFDTVCHNIIDGWGGNDITFGNRLIHFHELYINEFVTKESPNLIIWYEINGDPHSPPYNTLLDGSFMDGLSDEIIGRVNDGTAHIVVNTSSEPIGPIYDNGAITPENINLHTIYFNKANDLNLRPSGITWIVGDLRAEKMIGADSMVNVKSYCPFFVMFVIWY